MVVIPEQIAGSPDIAHGPPGMLVVVTVSVLAEDEPQMLLAVTRISPDVAVVVASMEFEVDVPVQPVGSVHV